MREAVFQPSRTLGVAARPSRPWPAGYGLALGGAASLVLWAGILWLLARVVG